MNHWHMLTLIGVDQQGIVAHVTKQLFESGVNLGETSMIRLGDHFTVMMMVSGELDEAALRTQLVPTAESLDLRLHIDAIDAHLHRHLVPNVSIVVDGADRAGIIAQVTECLLACEVNIVDLESDVAGSDDDPLYIMQINAVTDQPIEAVADSLNALESEGVSIRVSDIDTYLA